LTGLRPVFFFHELYNEHASNRAKPGYDEKYGAKPERISQ